MRDTSVNACTLLRIHEVAERLSVHQKTVDRWLRGGRLPYVRLPGGERRVRQADIDRLLTIDEPTP